MCRTLGTYRVSSAVQAWLATTQYCLWLSHMLQFKSHLCYLSYHNRDLLLVATPT